MTSTNGYTFQSSRIRKKNRSSRLTALFLICSCGTQKNPHHYSKRAGVVDPGVVANLYWLQDWVGMAPRMGRESSSCTFPLGRSVSRKAGKKINKYSGSSVTLHDHSSRQHQYDSIVTDRIQDHAIMQSDQFWV